MYEFLSDIGSYEQRKVTNFKQGDLTVDTAARSDGDNPYETGIKHPRYNKGEWVIVQSYPSKAEAEAGHQYWVDLMVKNPPSVLRDCANAGIAQLLKVLGASMDFERGLLEEDN